METTLRVWGVDRLPPIMEDQMEKSLENDMDIGFISESPDRTILRLDSESLVSESLCEVFPKLGVPFWGVLIIMTIVFWGLYWGTLI